jgi:hypothetical protein
MSIDEAIDAYMNAYKLSFARNCRQRSIQSADIIVHKNTIEQYSGKAII